MKTNHKPLKDKAFEIDPNSDDSAFWYEDVESAVKGLLEGLDDYVENVWKEGNAEEIRMAEIMKEDVKNLIKKWFPDVMKDE